MYWDITLLIGLQIAGAITPEQSPERDLCLHLAQTLAREIPEPDRPSLSTSAHVIVHMLVAWSLALELQTDLDITESRLLQIACSYVSLCEVNAVLLELVPQEYAITVLAPVRDEFLIGSSYDIDQVWTTPAQTGLLAFIATMMGRFYWNRFTPKSLQAHSTALFRLADWQARHRHLVSDSMQELSNLVSAISAGMEAGHSILEDCIKINVSSISTFRPPSLVLLDRQECADGSISSTWDLVAAAGISSSALTRTGMQLSIELCFMSALGLDTTSLADEFFAVDLLPMILTIPEYSGKYIASHLRRLRPAWWEAARSEIAAAPADTWPDDYSSAEFIADVEAAQSCAECSSVLETARKHGILPTTHTPRPWDGLVQAVIRPLRVWRGKRSSTSDIEQQAGPHVIIIDMPR